MTAWEENKIDLIVSAMEFKGGGGKEFINTLNTGKYKNIPVVIITSNDSIEERGKMFSLGVVDYIPKDAHFAERLFSFIDRITEESSVSNELSNMKIAVLDDSRMELNIIKNILALNGITRIDFFDNPRHLLSSNKKYHIFFIDLVLPDISGEQVILDIRKHDKECVIIAISAINNYKVISNILLSGADDYMLKPFNASIFMARLVANVRTRLLIKEVEKKKDELEEKNRTDPLTNIYNHKYMYDRLVDEINESKKQGKKLSIILLGIDNFISINDTFGHDVGDKILQSISRIIHKSLSDIDILGRYGGVEFMSILPETDIDEAYKVAEIIRQRVNSIKLKEKKITISGGVVELESETAMELIKKADTLLFNARKKGKNRIEKSFNWDNF